MPCAIDLAVRLQLIAEGKSGSSLYAIASQYHISYSSCLRIWKRYREGGEPAVLPLYGNCGRQPCVDPLVRRSAVWLKRHHPTWGAALIGLKLQQRYPMAIPSERSLQRWFKASGLKRTYTKLPAPKRKPFAQAPHHIWQLDGKEKVTLSNGKRLCYLTIVDERSGALLKAFVFPPLSLK